MATCGLPLTLSCLPQGAQALGSSHTPSALCCSLGLSRSRLQNLVANSAGRGLLCCIWNLGRPQAQARLEVQRVEAAPPACSSAEMGHRCSCFVSALPFTAACEEAWGCQDNSEAGWKGRPARPLFHVRVDTTLLLLLGRSDWAQILTVPLTASITWASHFSSLFPYL